MGVSVRPLAKPSTLNQARPRIALTPTARQHARAKDRVISQLSGFQGHDGSEALGAVYSQSCSRLTCAAVQKIDVSVFKAEGGDVRGRCDGALASDVVLFVVVAGSGGGGGGQGGR